MNVTGSIALVTGANRGIGRAFVENLLDRGASKVYVASLALTRSLRAELAATKTLVVAAMPVQVDTDMGALTDEAKVSPSDAASGTLDAINAGEVEVFSGELSHTTSAAFANDPKGVQACLSTLLPAAR